MEWYKKTKDQKYWKKPWLKKWHTMNQDQAKRYIQQRAAKYSERDRRGSIFAHIPYVKSETEGNRTEITTQEGILLIIR
jgi:hypothetical protein